MTNLMIAATAALVAGMESAVAQQTISPAAERPATVGAPDYFTGEVTVEPMFDASEYRNVSAAMVTFPPGAHAAWHTRPTGQTLVVVSGTGWTRIEGADKQVIKAGDYRNQLASLSTCSGKDRIKYSRLVVRKSG